MSTLTIIKPCTHGDLEKRESDVDHDNEIEILGRWSSVDDVVVLLMYILGNRWSDERNEIVLTRDERNNIIDSKCVVEWSCCRSMLVIDLARIYTLLEAVE